MLDKRVIVALNAVTATTTSGPIALGAMAKTSIQFLCASHTSGNGVFTIDVSNDNVTWTAYNKLTTNVTNTDSQTDTRVSSVTLSSNTSAVVSIPEEFAFLRVTCTVTTDGAYSAVVVTA